MLLCIFELHVEHQSSNPRLTLSSNILRQQCSIDALLEKTVKHMLFMQSVTKHADKLKHSTESKVSTCLL
jgi:hypothetical protein